MARSDHTGQRNNPLSQRLCAFGRPRINATIKLDRRLRFEAVEIDIRALDAVWTAKFRAQLLTGQRRQSRVSASVWLRRNLRVCRSGMRAGKV
jgi:hypothetical protein